MFDLITGVCKKPTIKEPEDLVSNSFDYYWVLDGATPPKGNHESTVEYVRCLSETMTTLAKTADSPKALLKDAIASMPSSFSLGDYTPYSTAVVIRVLENKIQYAVLSDSTLSISVNDKITQIIDDRLKKIAVEERTLVQQLRASGVNEESEEYLIARKKLIDKESESKNKEGGYWVASLNPEAADHAICGEITYNEDDSVIIAAATDGLCRLFTHFNSYSNLAEIAQRVWEDGTSLVFDELRTLEKDPANFRKPISSTNDDASFLILRRQ